MSRAARSAATPARLAISCRRRSTPLAVGAPDPTTLQISIESKRIPCSNGSNTSSGGAAVEVKGRSAWRRSLPSDQTRLHLLRRFEFNETNDAIMKSSRQRRLRSAAAAISRVHKNRKTQISGDTRTKNTVKKEKTRKRKRVLNKGKGRSVTEGLQKEEDGSGERQREDESTEPGDEDVLLNVDAVSPQSKLMSKFEERLKGGHFRFVNQGLYTSTGKDAFSLFQSNEKLFHEYHEGYLQSMKHWSIQPVDVAIRWLRKQPPDKNVVDYGCGEAKIMRAGLPQQVTSLDLVALHPGVIVCDMCHSPLEAASHHIAIFSLSLIGTDYDRCLLDAARVLKVGGILWIAEVCSRFVDGSGTEGYRPFLNALEALGFERTLAKKPSKFFIVLVLKKVRDVEKRVRIEWPALKPCLYKKR